MDFLRKINLARLAGIGTILGVDLEGDGVSIVELKARGNPFKEWPTRFEVRSVQSYEWGKAATIEEKAEKLLGSLKNSKTKFAVVNARSSAVRTLTVQIPGGVEDLNEWIAEHFDKLLKLPIPIDQVSVGYEVLTESTAGKLVEITFVKNSEIEDLNALFKKAKLDLLSVGAGSRDAPNVLIASLGKMNERDIRFYYADDRQSTRTTIVRGMRTEVITVPRSEVPDEKTGNSGEVVFASKEHNPPSSSTQLFKPWGLPSQYTVAAGLALKGLLPSLSPLNFLDAGLKERLSEKIAQLFLRRAALAVAALILLLLLGQILTEVYLQNRMDKIDSKVLSAGPLYVEVESLKKEVTVLEGKLSGSGATIKPTHLGERFHEIAEIAPDNLWFSSMKIDEQLNPGTLVLSIAGFARSSEQVTDFLKSLQRAGLCHSARLVKSGVSEENSGYAPVAAGRRGNILFDVRGELEK